MTQKGEQIHAFWLCMVAVGVVLGKKTRKKAEQEAYQELLTLYDEETIIRELEIPQDQL